MRSTVIVALAAMGLIPTLAEAHAFLDHAVPAVGSTVHQTPARVTLWFTQELEPAFSSVEVVNAGDKRVDKGDKHLAPDDRSVLEVSLPPLPPGDYRVNWRALSVDTHVTEGNFTFTVAP
jgi:methionine-rich copper-binding protein CopC